MAEKTKNINEKQQAGGNKTAEEGKKLRMPEPLSENVMRRLKRRREAEDRTIPLIYPETLLENEKSKAPNGKADNEKDGAETGTKEDAEEETAKSDSGGQDAREKSG